MNATQTTSAIRARRSAASARAVPARGLIAAAAITVAASAAGAIAGEPCEPPEGFIPLQTVEDLYAINADLTASYFLCNDIDLSGINFEPIGPGLFTGVFEGNNKRILNLTMEHHLPRVGFFERIGAFGGTVRNLTFVNPRVQNTYPPYQGSTEATGTLAARVNHVTALPGVIDNVHVVGEGYIEGANYVGGLVGVNFGLIQSSSVGSPHISVHGGWYVGGLVGNTLRNGPGNWGALYDSFSLAEVHAQHAAGGLAGGVIYAARAIRCYSAGKVFSEKGPAGAFTGTSGGQIFNWFESSTIEKSYAATLPGFEHLPFIVHCSWGCDLDDASGLRTVEQMQTLNEPTTFVGWDFINTWWHEQGQYPKLHPPVFGDLNGDGVVDGLDLLILLSQWGKCDPAPGNCPADLNGDGVVNVDDLLIVLNNWG